MQRLTKGADKINSIKTKSLFSNDMWKRTSQHFVDHRFSRNNFANRKTR